MSQAEEAHELAKEFSTPARKLKAVGAGETILEPLVYEDKVLFHQFTELKLHSRIRQIMRQALAAQKEVDLNDVIAQASMDLGISRSWVNKYFESARYKRWVTDRTKEVMDQQDLTVEYLMSKHKRNLEGEIKLTPTQMDSAKEIGDRIWPKVSKIEHEISQKEAVTLDEMPDFQAKVEEYEKKLKEIIPPNVT